MNLYAAVALFALIVVIYWIITELFTILFRFTGIPDERARFQVISLLTGCGFTTHESETFLTSRSRRNMARIMMLFGYVFNITIVSTLVNVFMTFREAVQMQNFITSALLPLLIVIAFFLIGRIKGVRKVIERLLEKITVRVLHQETLNRVTRMDYVGEDSIASVSLARVPASLEGKMLKDTGLKSEYGILVMLVEHAGKKAASADAETIFRAGDKLMVFGNYKSICKAFEAAEQFTDE